MPLVIQHCKECVDLLGEYFDGTLPAERAQALEEHLSQCMPCITFVRTYKATPKICRWRLARQMPEEMMSTLSSFLSKHITGFTGSKPDVADEAVPAAEPKKS